MYTNVIASYAPQKKKRLIVGAHYDVAGEQPGADDNASAFAGLLETARLLAASGLDLEYAIPFCTRKKWKNLFKKLKLLIWIGCIADTCGGVIHEIIISKLFFCVFFKKIKNKFYIYYSSLGPTTGEERF